MPKPNRLLLAVQEILLREWDPLHVQDHEACRNEYDSYAKAIFHLLQSDADAQKIAARLDWFERTSMCLPVIQEDLNRRIAQLLVELVEE